MLKANSAIDRRALRAGDFTVIENNTAGAAVNIIPEFPCYDEYRGNFHAVNTQDNQIAVYNTAFEEIEDSSRLKYAGTLQLRWQEIKKDEAEEKYFSLPRQKIAEVPVLKKLTVRNNGWLYLKMTRVYSETADFSFSDDYLGSVKLNFSWHLEDALPQPAKSSDIMPVATIIMDDEGFIAEIVQQHFGPGSLWIPLEVTEESSSSFIDDSSSSDDIYSSSSNNSTSNNDDDSISNNDDSSSGNNNDDSSSNNDDDSSGNDDSSSNNNDDSSGNNNDDSFSESSSSSDIISEEYVINVTLRYYETKTIRYSENATYTEIFEVNLTGAFTVNPQMPSNSYSLVMTGTESQDAGWGAGVNTVNVQHSVSIYKNEQLGLWMYFDQHAPASWGEYQSGYDSQSDTMLDTAVYNYPQISANMLYPASAIQVDHHIVVGTKAEIPDTDMDSTLQINFVRIV